MDKGMFKDKVIGKFDIDLSKIYKNSDDHAIMGQWVALSNPESQDYNAIKA